MLDFVIFAGTALIALIIVIFYLYPGSKRTTTIPGPDISDELEGNLPDIKAAGSLHQFLIMLHDTFGDIVSFRFGEQLCVSICSPELFKAHSAPFDRPSTFHELFKPLMTGDSIQYANGSAGRKRHAAYAHCYTHQSNEAYFSTLMQTAKSVCFRLGEGTQEDHHPASEIMFNFAITSILTTSFGHYFKDEKRVSEFRKSYDFTWSHMEKTLSDEDSIIDAEEDRFEKDKEKMFSILKEAAKVAKDHPSEITNNRLVDVVLSLDISESEKLADMLTFCIGGFHTTGLLLTWVIYYLGVHPEIQDKLYTEIQEVLGEEDLVYDAISKLKYMRQVLDETLRCSTLAPYASRVQDFDTELGGHKIPAGTPVIQALGVALSSPDIWQNPEEFDPERFSPENVNKLPLHAFEPFGFAGKRKCPGYRFSYVEATILLWALVRRFRISLVPDQVVQKVYGLVTKPKEEVWFTVEKRK